MTFGRIKYDFKKAHFEALFWIAAIILLATTDPTVEHASFCIAKNMGFKFCPGCGLGHSIAWLFRGEFVKSFQTHFFGIPAVIILLYRSFSLLKKDFSLKIKQN